MFVAIYRWRLTPSRVEEFRVAWTRVTRAIHAQCGSHGSSLFAADDGTHVGIACWPTRAAWEQCAAVTAADREAMDRCVAERYPAQLLESEVVLWDVPPPA